MRKPYAESTLRKKYRECGVEPDRITVIAEYLMACANFYQILEMKEARKILASQGGVTQEEMDAVFPIMERDGFLDFGMINQRDVYEDGDDEMLLIDINFITEENEDFDYVAMSKALLNDKEYDLSDMTRLNWDNFFKLDEARVGKPLYVPKDILPYANPLYYEETPQTLAMKEYLKTNFRLNKASTILRRIPDENGEYRSYSEEEIIDRTVGEMIYDIRNVTIPVSEQFPRFEEVLEDMGFKRKKNADMERYVALLQDLNNHTRMPSNRGFTPTEVFMSSEYTKPTQITFGPGMQEMLRSGELDGEEMMRSIMDNPMYSDEAKSALLQALNSALNPGKKN